MSCQSSTPVKAGLHADSLVYLDSTVELGADVAVLFAFVTDHAQLPRWAPGLRRVDVDVSAAQPDGVGTLRTLHSWMGPPGVERIVACTPPHHLAYTATDASLRGICHGHRAELTLTPVPGGTQLRWVVRLQPPRTWWQRAAARLMFQAAPRMCLNRLQALFPTPR